MPNNHVYFIIHEYLILQQFLTCIFSWVYLSDEESLDSGSTQGEIIMDLSKLKQDLGRHLIGTVRCMNFK